MSMTESLDVFDQCELVDLAGLSTEHPFDARSQAAGFDSTVEALLSGLLLRERLAIELRFGLNGHEPHTWDALGAVFGVCGARVRQIATKGLRRIRGEARYLSDDARQYLGVPLEKKEEARQPKVQKQEPQRIETPTEPLIKDPAFSYMQTEPSEFTLGGYGACRAMPHAEYRPPRDVQSDNISPGWYWQQICLDIVELRDFTGCLRGYAANMPGPGKERWLSVLRVGKEYFAHQTNGDRKLDIAMSRIENAARIQESTNTERTHAD